METSVIDSPEVAVDRDLTTGLWLVGVIGATYTVRSWTWGERKRMLARSVEPGTFSHTRFLADLVDLLVDPAPPAEHRSLLATITLRLVGVGGGEPSMPLLEAEAVFARKWRWGPFELDPQPAPEMDVHLISLSAGATPEADDHWHQIVVVDE